MTDARAVRSRLALLTVSALGIGSVMAQGTAGGCSITLLSGDGSDRQGFCVDPVEAVIDPIVYAIQGTGMEVTGLPAGITATLMDDTLTIAGTITTTGLWYPDITLAEGCEENGLFFGVSHTVDPQLTCTVDGDSIIVSWPGLDAPGQDDGTLFLFWFSDEELLGQLTYFLPCPGSFTVGGLPSDTPITFSLSLISGTPNCFTDEVGTICTVTSTGIEERAEDAFVVRAVPMGDVLQLSAPALVKEVRIHDVLGRPIVARAVNARTAYVPIAGLPIGAYLLRSTSADGRVSVQRFVKE